METIKESILVGCPTTISLDCTLKIIEQMRKNICKIKIGNEQGTGFFCKIPFPNKENMLPVFITNNHIINKKILFKDNQIITIKIKEDQDYKNINLNNRIKYANEEYDITIIQIKEKDDINNYMELDDVIINDIIENKNENADYQDETLYVIQYPEGKLSVSYGLLNNIYEDKKYNFIHSCSTKRGSSGSPILNINNKIIGIHKEGTDKKFNIGTFLNYPIKDFINNQKNNIEKSIIKPDNIPVCKKCKKPYNNKPTLLSCGDILCSSCIFFYEEWHKKEKFDCPICYKEVHSVHSTGFENKPFYPKNNEKESDKNFKIYIKNNVGEKYPIEVTKLMTVRQLKERIEEEKGYNKNEYYLEFVKPLNDEPNTLEYYGITNKVTLFQYFWNMDSK